MLAHLLVASAALSTVGVNGLHAHQHRPSLNFGANTPRKLTASILDTSDSPLVSFNAASSSGFKATGGDSGVAIAQAFLKQLHPQQEFRLQSKSQSAGNSVHHSYFIQTVGGRDVIDGLVNVNVDTVTGQIISYGDSAFIPTTACKSGSAPSLKQFVFGSSSPVEDKQCTVAAKQIIDTDAMPIDPRLAMANFVLQAAPSLLAEHGSLDDLVNTIAVSHSLTEEGGIKLLNVPGAIEDVPAKLSYVQREDGSLALTWSFEYQMDNAWYEAHISAAQDANDSAVPLMVVDWVRDAPGSKPTKPQPEPELEYSYRVFPWGTNDPSEGKRETVRSPADKVASPLGWHQIAVGAGRESGKKGGKVVKPESIDDSALDSPGWSRDLSRGATFKDTRGNNVYAQDNPSGGSSFENNFRPRHNESGAFNYKLGWGKHPEGKHIDPVSYINASITELFYTINEIHDLTYHYGFDEASGNFQSHNYGKGGLGGDPVIANAQDGSGMNNANFGTPPDGQSGRMRMYSWNAAEPYSDGDLEAGIVIHEYTHGISTRLVGGPANSGCLGWGEAGGMGEGYGDFLATMIRMKDGKVHDYNMGAWAAHRAGGIRPHPYSTNKTINPDTYKTLDKPGYWGVHAIGSVYAEYLFEVAEALIEKRGWTKSLFPPAVESEAHDDFFVTNEETGRKHPRHGNTYVLQLFIDAFKLCPCRPSFIDHRDAMLQADHVYTGGENACTIWKAYAKRGLGPDASLRGGTPWGGGIRTESYSIPKHCIGSA